MDHPNSKAKKSVVVTGANGFVGRNLCEDLHKQGFQVAGALRRQSDQPPKYPESVVDDLFDNNRWVKILTGTDVVIHCAGIAHQSSGGSAIEIAKKFDEVNRGGAVNIARIAAECAVQRFIFISSVGVYGHIPDDCAASEEFECNPREPYAISKLDAERELIALCQDSTMELVILRPPMIYGPLCPGNFSSLTKLVKTHLPIPLGSINSNRNYVAIENLMSLVAVICDQQEPANGIYNIGDSEETSLVDTIQLISEGLGIKNKLFKVPKVLIKTTAGIVRKSEAYSKLTESVRIDSEKARRDFKWTPPVSPTTGVVEAAASFK